MNLKGSITVPHSYLPSPAPLMKAPAPPRVPMPPAMPELVYLGTWKPPGPPPPREPT